jgi:hypothetical protein
MPLVLYQRDECELCDEALHVLAQARVAEFESVWIDGNPELESRYGDRVPVLHSSPAGPELEWPFDPAELLRFLGSR